MSAAGDVLFGRAGPDAWVEQILRDFARIAGRTPTGDDVEELAATLEALAQGLRARNGQQGSAEP